MFIYVFVITMLTSNRLNNIPYCADMARIFITDEKGCVRPTASTRRCRNKQVTSSEKGPVDDPPREAYMQHHEANEPHQEVNEPHQDIRVDGVEVHGYPGGPTDCSILKTYGDHVARQIWEGEVM